MGKTYQAKSPEKIPNVAQEIEDIVSNSGKMVTIARDDKKGVLIEVEDTIQ